MQGFTNAAPPSSGGLRIVASALVPGATTSGWQTITLPEPALFAVIYSRVGDGYWYSCPVMLAENGAYTAPDPTEKDLLVQLTEGGTEIKYQNRGTKNWIYTAYA